MGMNNTAGGNLTTTEVGNLWNSYMFESMVHHVFLCFFEKAEDQAITSQIGFDIDASRLHLENYMRIFRQEKLPNPRGTTSEDVNLNAPRLFTDAFYITYIKSLARFALTNSTMAFTQSHRSDIKAIFKDYIDRLLAVEQKVTDIMVSKGLYPTAPVVHHTGETEFVEKNNFFAGYFGEQRKLTILEVNQLFGNIHSNELGKALLTGFSRTTKNEEVKKYFDEGIELSNKFIKDFAEKLQNEGVSGPPSLANEVMDFAGDIAPFTERLMLNHVVFLNAYGIGNYGLSLAQSQRNDLTVMYGKVLVEVGMYAKKGAELLIKNQWLEQSPIYNG